MLQSAVFVLFVAAVVATTIIAVPVLRMPTITSIFTSDNTGNRFSKNSNPIVWSRSINKAGDCSSSNVANQPSICINTQNAQLFQEMDGFGGSFLRSGAISLNQLSPPVQEQVLNALFHPSQGAGFRVGKVPIAATDFMPPVWYSYWPNQSQPFDISHDLEYFGGTVPYIKRAAAVAGRNISLQSPMDFPPLWMLTNQTSPMSGPINKTFYPQLAQYYLWFAQAFERNGAPIEYVALFNEPTDSYCFATNDQIEDLLVNHVGPLFRKTPGAPKLTWGAQYGRRETLYNYTSLMMKPEVQKYMDIIFYHGYDCGDEGGWVCGGDGLLNATCPELEGALEAIATVKKMFPQFKMWMSELCYAAEFGDYPPDPKMCPQLPRYDFFDAMQWGRMIFGDVNAGASAWIYWNMILNNSGGPWLVAPEFNDPHDNLQQPLIITNPDKDTFSLTGAFFALAHFGRYVLPGMRRLEHSRSTQLPTPNIYSAVFVDNSNASAPAYVIQLMNDQLVDQNVQIVFDKYVASVTLPAVSLVSIQIASELDTGHDIAAQDDDDSTAWIAPTAACVGAVLLGGIGFIFVIKRRAANQNRDDESLIEHSESTNYQRAGAAYQAPADLKAQN